MQKKFLAAMLFILFLTLFPTGCGGGGSSSTGTDGDTADGDDTSTDGDLPPGDIDEPEPTDGDDTDGDVTDGDTTDGDAPDGDIEDEIPTYTDCVALYGAGWSFNPVATSGDGCKDCSTKDCPADSSVGIFHLTTEKGRCVCETKEGHFFSDTTFLPMACDKDDDGWTTVTAREFVESDDVALSENARCDVRRVSEFVLVPEEDYPPIIMQTEGVDLYEPNNRDDQDLLDTDTSRAPSYGQSGRADGRYLRAEELNSLTKACVSANADYNGNGVSDIAEWPGGEGLDASMLDYAPFAYFIELMHGFYDADSGRYYLLENSRSDSPSDLDVPIVYAEGEDGHWRVCNRRTDASYDPDEPTITCDFAGAPGMLHHSQFKCLHAVAEADLDPAQPQKMTVAQIQAGYVLNDCAAAGDGVDGDSDDSDGDAEADGVRSYRADGDDDLEDETEPITVPEPDPEIANPAYPTITCQADDNVVTGDIGFAAAKYVNYMQAENYQHGCVNECVEGWSGIVDCSGYPDAAGCDTDLNAFGQGMCGCVGNYAYPECTSCKNHYDIATDCMACILHWDIESACTSCEGNFSLASGCTDCKGHWTGANCDRCEGNWSLASNCTECKNHFDRSTDCEDCLYSADDGYWTGNNCNSCDGNFDKQEDCKECLDTDDDGHWAGADCESCKENYYVGSFASDNMVNNPYGSNNGRGWTPGTSSTLLQSAGSGGNAYLRVTSAGVGGAVFAYQMVDLQQYMARISSDNYSGITITASAYAKLEVPNTYEADVTVELMDKKQQNLSSRTFRLQTLAAEMTQLGPYTFTVDSSLREMRYLKFTLVAYSNHPLIAPMAGFRAMTVLVNHEPSSPQPCRFCEDGWIDSNPDDEEPDCLYCPSGVVDSGHWDNSYASMCNACWDDDTNGHWDYPNCDTCRLLWGDPYCSTCPTDRFDKDSSGECSKTVNLMQNGSAEDMDFSMWDSNFVVTRFTNLNDISDASDKQYFYCFHDVDGEHNPYMEQRITLSDPYLDLIESGNIGWLHFSADLAAHTDNDEPRFKVYQVVNAGGDGSQCGSTLDTTSRTWVEESSYCEVNPNVTELRIRLEVENDNGGQANGYFDDMKVYLSAKKYE